MVLAVDAALGTAGLVSAVIGAAALPVATGATGAAGATAGTFAMLGVRLPGLIKATQSPAIPAAISRLPTNVHALAPRWRRLVCRMFIVYPSA